MATMPPNNFPSDPDETKQYSNICKWCSKPMDNHCFLHNNGYPLCPGKNETTSCVTLGPRHKEAA